MPKVSRVDYDMKPVQPEAVWPRVIQQDSMWTFAREASFKRACREILTKEKFYKKEAGLLQKHILKNFAPEKMYKEFVDVVLGHDSGTPAADTPEETILEF